MHSIFVVVVEEIEFQLVSNFYSSIQPFIHSQKIFVKNLEYEKQDSGFSQ